MCTLTILKTPAETIITMNRDERRERHETGKLVETDGVVYPQDSVSAGTWIGMNGQGMVLAILNRYQSPHQPERASRGGIIPDALKQPSPVLWLRELDPTPFNPFDLFCASRDQLWHCQWDGDEGEQGYRMREVHADNGVIGQRSSPGVSSAENTRESTSTDNNHMANNPDEAMAEAGFSLGPEDYPWGTMFSSSSYKTDEVLAYRHGLFREWLAGTDKTAGGAEGADLAAAILNDFHLRQDEGCAEKAVLMEREWSHTKSIVQVRLGREGAELAYYPDCNDFNGSEIYKSKNQVT